ncbi:hypothetical protein HJG60_009457 [Phyllostomus discolor]|uniref:Uncharacterized protein n=1 Tax=Phyllostomus discolor TaxID=89673 RepID=A0A833YII8_9CHIR|nr:hypothetical protein HJG60_009457 [Phyllostomus discolor]
MRRACPETCPQGSGLVPSPPELPASRLKPGAASSPLVCVCVCVCVRWEGGGGRGRGGRAGALCVLSKRMRWCSGEPLSFRQKGRTWSPGQVCGFRVMLPASRFLQRKGVLSSRPSSPGPVTPPAPRALPVTLTARAPASPLEGRTRAAPTPSIRGHSHTDTGCLLPDL